MQNHSTTLYKIVDVSILILHWSTQSSLAYFMYWILFYGNSNKAVNCTSFRKQFNVVHYIGTHLGSDTHTHILKSCFRILNMQQTFSHTGFWFIYTMLCYVNLTLTYICSFNAHLNMAFASWSELSRITNGYTYVSNLLSHCTNTTSSNSSFSKPFTLKWNRYLHLRH